MLRRGRELHIEDSEGGANVAALFYNHECLAERYNMPDTLKAQHTAHLTKGCVLYSDMGRVLCSITNDTRGWHDPLGGHNDARAVAAKYGASSYQEQTNVWHQDTMDNFLTELEKYGLGLRDLSPSVNFFSKVVVGKDGSMEFVAGKKGLGDSVTLRAEMNVLVILDTGQHPLDPNPRYAPKSGSKSTVREASSVAADDPCRLLVPGNARRLHQYGKVFPMTESALEAGDAIYDQTVLSGDGWIQARLKPGEIFRIVDLEGEPWCRRYAFLQRPGHLGTLQCNRYHRRTAQHLSDDRDDALFQSA